MALKLVVLTVSMLQIEFVDAWCCCLGGDDDDDDDSPKKSDNGNNNNTGNNNSTSETVIEETEYEREERRAKEAEAEKKRKVVENIALIDKEEEKREKAKKEAAEKAAKAKKEKAEKEAYEKLPAAQKAAKKGVQAFAEAIETAQKSTENGAQTQKAEGGFHMRGEAGHAEVGKVQHEAAKQRRMKGFMLHNAIHNKCPHIQQELVLEAANDIRLQELVTVNDDKLSEKSKKDIEDNLEKATAEYSNILTTLEPPK